MLEGCQWCAADLCLLAGTCVAAALWDCRYALVCCNSNSGTASSILKRQQQEQVSFERNTIWKDMVGQERRAATLHVQVRLARGYAQWGTGARG